MIIEQIVWIVVSFYLGVFLCDKAGLKFGIIAYPFVKLFELISKKTKERKIEDAKEKTESK
jgi:hypothetical protein